MSISSQAESVSQLGLVVGPLNGGVLTQHTTFIIFLAWDYYKGDAAMIPFSMLRKRTVWSSLLVFEREITRGKFSNSYRVE